MAKPRKRHVQLELPVRDKNGQRRGGKRAGAGRHAKGPRPSEPHLRRPRVRACEPIHVVLRVTPAIGRLRKHKTYAAVRRALVTARRHDQFRIVHISIQQTHLHLLVEAADRMTLARGMQGFQISAAKHLNAAVSEPGARRRRGCVFTDRYHAEIVTSPRQARNTLAYVLNNWRRHRADRDSRWPIDPFSSGASFDGWREPTSPGTSELAVRRPRSWLLREGWRRHGLIGVAEVPG